MNNFLSYCGLVDPRISASDKDLPVKDTLRPSGAILNVFFYYAQLAKDSGINIIVNEDVEPGFVLFWGI